MLNLKKSFTVSNTTIILCFQKMRYSYTQKNLFHYIKNFLTKSNNERREQLSTLLASEKIN